MKVKSTASFYLKQALLKLIFRRPFSFVLIGQKLRLISTILRGERLRKKNERIHHVAIPQVCILSVTNQCNLTCKGCYASRYSSADMLEMDDIEKAVREATQLGVYFFIIAGGEPLLVENLIPVLRKYNKAIFLLFTNGLLLNRELLKQIKHSFNIVPVLSFEGNKALNDYRRGNGTGNMLDRSLRLLKQSKVLFGFSTMAIRENVDYITSKDYMEKMAKHDASFGFIVDYVPVLHKENSSLCLSQSDVSKKICEVMKRRRDSRMILFNFPGDEGIFNHCGAGKEVIHISATGHVEPCPFSHYAKDNIKHKSLLQVLKSDFFSQLRACKTRMKQEEGRCMLHLNDAFVQKIVAETEAFETITSFLPSDISYKPSATSSPVIFK